MKLTFTFCFSLLLYIGQAMAQLPNVLIVHAATQSYVDDVDSKLTATGSFSAVDQLNVTSLEPTLSQLTSYDVLLVFTDDSPADAVSLGDTVAAYLDAGGAVVNCVFALAESPLQGAFETNYQVLIPGTQDDGTRLTLGTVHNSSHPIMNGVTTFDGGEESFRGLTTLETGTVVIAEWSDGEPLIAVRPGLNRVDLNFYPPSTGARSDFWDATTHGTKIMTNSLIFAISATTGIEKKQSSISFQSVFPNPNEGIFALSVHSKVNKKSTLEIVDVYGKTVLTQPVDFYIGDNTVSVKTVLEKGLYTIGIPSENAMYKMMVK